MSSVRVVNPTPWEVSQPIVFRYMQRGYVDAFFDDGSLRLSSFGEFRKHPQEQRIDTQEGRFQLSHFQKGLKPEDNRYFHLSGLTNPHTYVLCGHMSNDPELHDENNDAYVAIQDTVSFAGVIASKLTGFVRGMEGPCVYQTSRSLAYRLGGVPLTELGSLDEPPNLPQLRALIAERLGHLPYFLKHQSYRADAEYRWIWFVNPPAQPYIDLKVPEAREFCFADNSRAWT